MRCYLAFVVAVAVACGDTAIVVEIRSDGLSVPSDVDAFCLAVADDAAAGGEFARLYSFDDDLTELPQTLTIEPGGADVAELSVRGYKNGIEVARDRAIESFSGISEISMTLAACPGGTGGEPAVVGGASVPAGTRVAVSFGRGGSRVVAVGPNLSSVFVASDAGMDELGVSTPEVGAPAGPREVIAFDADGDCDDDILVVPDASAPELWRRESDGSFTLVEDAFPAGLLAAERAAAAADIDGDFDIDLAIGGAGSLILLLNSGAGQFQPHPTPTPVEASTDVTALAFGDLDDDGDADLIVGRGEGVVEPVRALFNGGTGGFQFVAAALPEVPLFSRTALVRDIDGDGARDLLLGAQATNVRLYVNRTDGRLEDRSFISLPSTDPIDPSTVAAADWNGDCITDVLVGLEDGTPALSWTGADGAALIEEVFEGAGSGQATLADVDDDGDNDAVLVDSLEGLTWARR